MKNYDIILKATDQRVASVHNVTKVVTHDDLGYEYFNAYFYQNPEADTFIASFSQEYFTWQEQE